MLNHPCIDGINPFGCDEISFCIHGWIRLLIFSFQFFASLFMSETPLNVSFLAMSLSFLSCPWYQGYVSLKMRWRVFSLFLFFRRVCMALASFLPSVFLGEFTVEVTWAWSFLCGKNFNDFNFFNSYMTMHVLSF